MLLLLVVALGVAAAGVAPREAQAYKGPNPYKQVEHWPEIWEWIRDGEPKTLEGGSRGPGGNGVWNRIRTGLGRFPSRFTGVLKVGGNAAVGGYMAWKFCSDVLLTDCDFLGLRDTIGEWGDTTTRNTTHLSMFRWDDSSGDGYWYLRATVGVDSGLFGGRAYIETLANWDGDGGTPNTWQVGMLQNQCSQVTTTVCREQNLELHAVFNTATRGSLHTVVLSETKRIVYRRYVDADFQAQIKDESEYHVDPPDTTTWPDQTSTTYSKPSDPAPAFEGSEWIIVQEELDALPETGAESQEEVGVELDPEWTGLGFTMPDCLGLSVSLCLDELAAAGHTGTTTFVELDIATADVTRPAGAVVATDPAGGADATLEDDVELQHNPDGTPEEMPLLLPEPNLGETYADYVTRLQGLGWVGTATVTELSEAAGDPALGPNAPVTVTIPEQGSYPGRTRRVGQPWPETRAWPTTDITFTKNPPGYPPVTTPGGPASGVPDDGEEGPECDCPPVDFTPLETDMGDKFPFGLFSYVSGFFAEFGATATAPSFSIEKPAGLGGGMLTVTAPEFTYKGLTDSIMKFITIIASIWFAGTWIIGWNRGDSVAD